MGSGASKTASGSASRPVTVTAKGKPGVSRSGSTKGPRQPDEFDAACLVVFRNADLDHSGTLNRDEFWSVLKSKTLDLNLSNEEMEDMQRLADSDGDGTPDLREASGDSDSDGLEDDLDGASNGLGNGNQPDGDVVDGDATMMMVIVAVVVIAVILAAIIAVLAVLLARKASTNQKRVAPITVKTSSSPSSSPSSSALRSPASKAAPAADSPERIGVGRGSAFVGGLNRMGRAGGTARQRGRKEATVAQNEERRARAQAQSPMPR